MLRFAKIFYICAHIRMSRSHVSFAFASNFNLARKSGQGRANMTKVFQLPFFSMLFFPCDALNSLAMVFSQHVILPDLAADTHAHFLALPRRPDTPEEAAYTGCLLVGEVV